MDWFRCFPSEYCFDTRDLALAEHGAYLLLLFYMYSTEKPVQNLEEGQRICGARTEEERFAVQRVLERFFKQVKAGYVHKRVRKEMAYVAAKRKLASKAGKISGSKRALGHTQRMIALEAKDSALVRRSDRMEAAQSLATHTVAEWGLLVGFCGGKCLKCGVPEVGKDHIQPISCGGSDGIENIQPLCHQCNTEKHVDTVDYRPVGWREFIEQTLNARSAHVNGSQQSRLEKIRLENQEKDKKPSPPPKLTDTETFARKSFERFWVVYPKQIDRDICFRLWLALGSIDQDKAAESVPAWLKSESWSETKYIPNPETFIVRRRWESTPAVPVNLADRKRELEAKFEPARN